MAVLTWSLQHKRDTAANFTSVDPVLKAGQLGIETDGLATTPRFKIGNGTTAWSALPYANSSSSYTAGSGLTLTGGVFSLGGTLTGNVAFSGAFNIDFGNASISLSGGTASRVLGTNASNVVEYINTTGTGNLVRATSPTFGTDIGIQGSGTGSIQLRGLDTATTFGSIYFNGNTGITNYALSGTSSFTLLNAPTTLGIRISNNDLIAINNTSITFTPQVATSGATTPFRVTIPANTSQTASSEVQAVIYTLSSTAWATSPPTTQRGFQITAPTYSAPSGTMTTGATFTITNAPTASGIIITNPYALWVQAGISAFGGNIRMANNTVLQGFDSTGTIRSLMTWTSGDNITIAGRPGTTDITLNPRSSGDGLIIKSTGRVGVAVASPLQMLHLPAGTAAANTAPLVFTSGTNLTVAVSGVMEYNNTFHLTNSDATRRHIVLAPNTTKVTAAAPYANDGYIVVNIGGTDFRLMTTA